MPNHSITQTNVLVVDDCPVARLLHAETLRSLGFDHITTAKDGEEGLLALQDKKFDLVLSDIEMPGMSGIKFLEKIRSDLGQWTVPVFLVSSLNGADDKEIDRAYIEIAAKRFYPTVLLSKPVNPEVVREQLLAANLL